MFPPDLLPYLDDKARPSESISEYLRRVSSFLPGWPDELLREWLYWHAGQSPYLYLDLHCLNFERQAWALRDIPGSEVYENPYFCDDMKGKVGDLDRNPRKYSGDWLLHFMCKSGTWPTPIVLLRTEGLATQIGRRPLNHPFHLLEGLRRLAFLNGLREIGRAQAQHDVFVATFNEFAAS